MAMTSAEIRARIQALEERRKGFPIPDAMKELEEVSPKDTAAVRRMQEMLLSKGLYKGNVDGQWSTLTRKAVEDYNDRVEKNKTERSKALDARKPIDDELSQLNSQLGGVSRSEEMNTPYEQARQVGINLVPGLSGYGLGHYSANALDDRLNARALYRAEAANKLASQIGQLSPEAISRTASDLRLTGTGRGAGLSYLTPAAFVGLGLGTRAAASQISNETGQDSARVLGSGELGYGAGMLGQKLFRDTSSLPVADPIAIAKIHDAISGARGGTNGPVQLPSPVNQLELTANPPTNSLALPQPSREAIAIPDASPSASTQPAELPENRYRGAHGEVLPSIAEDFGVKTGKSKAQTASSLLAHIDKADETTLRAVAAKVPGVDENGSIRALRNGLKEFVNDIGSRGGRLPVIGGLGLGLAALGSDDANAGPARDESIAGYRMRQLGLDTPANALNTASYLTPGIGEGRMAYDVGSAAGRAVNALSQPRSVIYAPPRPDDGYNVQSDPMQEGFGQRTINNLGLARQEDARQRQELMSRGRIPIGSEAFRNLQQPGQDTSPQNALAGAFAGGAPQGNPQQQTQAPSPIQRPQSIPAEPQEAEAPPRPTPKIPDDYQPGPLQRKQEKMIENALRQKEQERMMQNELALQGPDGNFYRALQAFQQHFAGAGAAAAGAR